MLIANCMGLKMTTFSADYIKDRGVILNLEQVQGFIVGNDMNHYNFELVEEYFPYLFKDKTQKN